MVDVVYNPFLQVYSFERWSEILKLGQLLSEQALLGLGPRRCVPRRHEEPSPGFPGAALLQRDGRRFPRALLGASAVGSRV